MSKKLQGIYISALIYKRKIKAHRYICGLSGKHVLQIIAEPWQGPFDESYTVISKSLITLILETY